MSEQQAKYLATLNRDCTTCARLNDGKKICPLPKIDVDTCLGNKSRPFWRPSIWSIEHIRAAKIMANESKVHDPDAPIKGVADYLDQLEVYPDSDYTKNSLVSKKADRINELVSAHWSYMEKTLTAGQDKSQVFSWDQVMEMRKWDYTSAATHFYGHGYEDGKNGSE